MHFKYTFKSIFMNIEIKVITEKDFKGGKHLQEEEFVSIGDTFEER